MEQRTKRTMGPSHSSPRSSTMRRGSTCTPSRRDSPSSAKCGFGKGTAPGGNSCRPTCTLQTSAIHELPLKTPFQQTECYSNSTEFISADFSNHNQKMDIKNVG